MKGCLFFSLLLSALLFGCIASPFQYGARAPSGSQANNSVPPTVVYKFICADGNEAGNASGCPAIKQNKSLDGMAKECSGDDCVIALAVQYENPALCKSAIDSNNCYSTLAMRFKNRGYCALGYGAEQCYAEYDKAYPQAHGNSTQSKTVEELYAACGSDLGCITTLAVQVNNPALCARLTSVLSSSRYMENNCYVALAARYNNKAYCTLIIGDVLASQQCNNELGK